MKHYSYLKHMMEIKWKIYINIQTKFSFLKHKSLICENLNNKTENRYRRAFYIIRHPQCFSQIIQNLIN